MSKRYSCLALPEEAKPRSAEVLAGQAACRQHGRGQQNALGSISTSCVVCRGGGRTGPRQEGVRWRGWELAVACAWHVKRPWQLDMLVWAEAVLVMVSVR